MSTKPNAVLYARFSKRARDGKVVTLESQLEDERRRAKKDGCQVVAEFADDGFSAFNPKVKRPDWNAMLDFVEANPEVNRIYTRESDRTSRQKTETALLLAFCAEHEITLVEGGVETAPDDDDAQDMRLMKSMFDERYSRSISKKTRNAREKAALAGRSHPGARPFGYNKDRRTLDPVEGPAYRALFDRVIDGEALHAIAVDWEERGILNRNGRRFSSHAMKQLLTQPRAVGKRVHRGEVIGAGDWEPITTEEVQRAAIAAHRGRRRLRTARSPVRSARFLSSMVFCGACDGPMRVRYNDHPRQAAQYSCNPALRDSCGHVHVLAELAEAEVEKRLLQELRKPKTHRAIEKMRTKRPDVSNLLTEIQELEDDLQGYTADAAAGRLNRARFNAIAEGHEARLAELHERLNRATEMPTPIMSATDLVDRWEKLSLDEQRRALAGCIERIRILPSGGKRFDPNRVKVDWRF